MKKKFLNLMIVLSLSLAVTAQSEYGEQKVFKFGIAATGGLPIGDLKVVSSAVFGGELHAEYALAPTFGVSLSAGFLNFSGKYGIGSTGLFPILLGGKFHFTEKLYGHAQLGVSISTETGGGNAFTYAPSIGYDISDKIDVAFKYQTATKNGFNSSFIGIRITRSF